jgi:hypothetical protein
MEQVWWAKQVSSLCLDPILLMEQRKKLPEEDNMYGARKTSQVLCAKEKICG